MFLSIAYADIVFPQHRNLSSKISKTPSIDRNALGKIQHKKYVGEYLIEVNGKTSTYFTEKCASITDPKKLGIRSSQIKSGPLSVIANLIQ